ncbi:MAG TPA: UDP-N-acetylmuramate:L-alanyl-gamma-D-glutamyl-meso-diaminopimelate ligase [Steroidobacteraceae bacterium]|jgi:UDP-N-acetylmuramate: L-alanyl-gamma-D-glutamyl-meso-diaminopimelate ligase|nr:UDP-N-acetylmuramate:L-alanyl-gamma-D-glutamyl-meso-diaminopimelate ligase [Steroidobacteraceae bacterium]
MHVHILGIAGTFMGGLAAIAKAAGHRVTGSDLNVYPPMSTQLEALGIELVQGYGAEQLDLNPDLIVVGNALSRGRPVVEAMLDRGLPHASGPAWLAEHVLAGRHVLAVAGTHGKTTTTAMLCWILEEAGLQPGFLIGGMPSNFDSTARLGAGNCFVIEADEYDTAFFDKRAKFVHYGPRTAILNNLEYDHADIYPDVASIRRQFNQLLRTVPGAGRLIVNGRDPELAATLREGCWTPVEHFGMAAAAGSEGAAAADPGTAGRSPGGAGSPAWSARMVRGGAADHFEVLLEGRILAEVRWSQLGEHNVTNGLAAIAAARHVGVDPARAAAALGGFRGVKRRMEIRGVVGGVTVYDDFAHHPTAIETTLKGLRARVGTARIVAVLEPRSNTMKLGVHREQMAPALADADRTWFLTVPDLDWDLPKSVAALGPRASFADGVEPLVSALAAESRPGDHILVMSNGGFGGLHDKLLAALRARA